MTESKQICGADLLRNPQLNRADAFTQEERDARGLRGLLPPAVSTMELQVKRTLALLDRCPTALDKFLMLDSLHATDEDLYFKILIDYIDDYMPVVYTPTVGEVCQKFSHIYRYPRGAFISINDKGRVREIIENCPNEEVDVIVVTDGQRILGLGDLGINGMGIPCGKLSLYTACAGIAPEKTLPVTIDVGTNNPEYLNDPMYLGLRQERVTGEAYDELIEEFVTEARRRWPNVLIQFEDFGNNHAFDLLERYKDKVLCFNSLSYLDSYAYSLSYSKPALLFYIFFEGYSLYQFHNNIVYSIFITDIIYVYNISVYKSCRRLCFHTELSHKRPVLTKFWLKNLNGYKAIQLVILRLVHIRHSSGSNLSKYLISICNKYRLFHITSY